MRRYTVRFTPEAENDLLRLYGFLLEKNVVDGGTIEPGARLFRIAPLGRIWIDAQLYASDVDVVTVGAPAIGNRTESSRCMWARCRSM